MPRWRLRLGATLVLCLASCGVGKQATELASKDDCEVAVDHVTKLESQGGNGTLGRVTSRLREGYEQTKGRLTGDRADNIAKCMTSVTTLQARCIIAAGNIETARRCAGN